MQINGVVPTVSIDKTDGCQIYLNKNTLDADIITAKSSEMNILIPNAEGDFVSVNVLHLLSNQGGRSLLRPDETQAVQIMGFLFERSEKGFEEDVEKPP